MSVLSREHGLAQLLHHLTVLEYLAIAVPVSFQYPSQLFPLPAEASGDVSVLKESKICLHPALHSIPSFLGLVSQVSALSLLLAPLDISIWRLMLLKPMAVCSAAHGLFRPLSSTLPGFGALGSSKSRITFYIVTIINDDNRWKSRGRLEGHRGKSLLLLLSSLVSIWTPVFGIKSSGFR